MTDNDAQQTSSKRWIKWVVIGETDRGWAVLEPMPGQNTDHVIVGTYLAGSGSSVPWGALLLLVLVGAARRDGAGAVLSCSALKRSYRDWIGNHGACQGHEGQEHRTEGMQ